MTVREMTERVELQLETASDCLGAEVAGGHAGDLLSTVMANAGEGDVWVTWHVHPNIVAAALVARLSAIILVNGRDPEEETARKAEQEGVAILVTKLSAFEIIGRLYGMGIMGAE